MLSASRAHLAAAGETYGEHMRFALTVGKLAVGAGLACMLHAFVPGVCQTSCSRTVAQLQRLFADRRLLGEVQQQSSGVSVFAVLTVVAVVTASFALIAGAGHPLTIAAALQAFALPALYVAQNPALDPV
jgi:hypothetical protein